MPDTLEAPAVAETAVPPAETTAAPAAPAEKTGVAALMGGFKDRGDIKPATDKAEKPAKGEAKDKAAPVPAEKKAEATPAPAKEALTPTKPAKGEDGIKSLRDGHEKSVAEWRTKEAEYQKQIKELKDRPERHPDDQKAIADLKKSIAEADYRKSDEFKSQFVEPINRAYSSTLEMVKQWNIETEQADGQKTSRAATERDFREILRADEADRAELAFRKFGQANGTRLLGKIDKLIELDDQGNQRARAAAEQADKTAQERAAQDKDLEGKFNERREISQKEAEEEFPDIFGEHADDPDSKKMLEAGREFVTAFRAAAKTMAWEDLAVHEAVYDARAVAFPVVKHQRDAFKAKAESLEAELKKYRDSSPGGERGSGGQQPPGETGKVGIAALGDAYSKYDSSKQ